jgi:predicted enzyme related to lactoylglutathione lyase
MMAKQPHMPPEMPSFWMPYFLVTAVDATAEKAKSLGAQIHFGPQDIPGTDALR